MSKNIANFFKSNVGLLVLGFILTTICGGFINEMHTRSTWKRDKRFELLGRELTKHEELLSDLTKVVGARTFRLQRVVFAMDSPDSPAPETWQLNDEAKNKLNARWDEYYQTVIDWNLNYRSYATKIRVLAGEDVANEFFSAAATGARRAGSQTVCGGFEQTHDVVVELKKTALTAQIDRAKHDQAQREVDDLYDRVDRFVTRLYRALGDKEQSDDPFKPGRSRP